jgi:hypothetical protein
VAKLKNSRVRDKCAKERHPKICYYCKNYRECVSTYTYCPAYGNAYLYNYGTLQNKVDIINELAMWKAKGWSIQDLCAICNHKCKLTTYFGLTMNRGNYCVALRIVSNIPCKLDYDLLLKEQEFDPNPKKPKPKIGSGWWK